MNKPRKIVDIVLPFYNESQNLKILIPKILKTIKEIRYFKFRVIFVDDGSIDGGKLVVNKYRKKNKNTFLIIHTKHVGKTACYKSYFKKFKTKYFITMDSDNQDDPKYIKTMLEFILKSYDFVLTKRKKRKHTTATIILGSVYVFFIALYNKKKLSTYFSSIACFKRKSIPYKNLIFNDHRYFSLIAINNGAEKIKIFPVLHKKRRYGVTKYNTFKKIFFAIPEFLFFILRLKMGFFKL